MACAWITDSSKRDQVALEHVHALFGLAQLVLGPPHDHLALVIDVVLDDLAQRQRARDVVDERDHVDTEGRLHRRVLVELVQDDFRDRSALELDHDTHALVAGVILDV
jgi:hypothetical protein